MLPLILVSGDTRKTSRFLKNFISEQAILKHFVFEIEPVKKEITIDQIREIKKNIMYRFSQPQLFIIHNFDTASYPAQNAFLKTLEEHQKNIFFILVVNGYHHLAPTIISRSKVIQLEKNGGVPENKEIASGLETLIAKKTLRILGDKPFQAKSRSNPLNIFDEMTEYFRRRMAYDKNATQILREILTVRYAVERNNVNPQDAIDHLLISIYKTYP